MSIIYILHYLIAVLSFYFFLNVFLLTACQMNYFASIVGQGCFLEGLISLLSCSLSDFALSPDFFYIYNFIFSFFAFLFFAFPVTRVNKYPAETVLKLKTNKTKTCQLQLPSIVSSFSLRCRGNVFLHHPTHHPALLLATNHCCTPPPNPPATAPFPQLLASPGRTAII